MPRLPRDRYPRICDALCVACSLTLDEAEAIGYSTEVIRGRVLARQAERRQRPKRWSPPARQADQKVLWTGARRCLAGQGELFDA